MSISINDLIVCDTSKVADAWNVIDRNGMGVAFIVNGSGSLVGVVTDGNIRRLLLGGGNMTDSVTSVMTFNCVSLPVDSPPEMISNHLNNRIHLIPLLDKNNRPVDYASHFRNHRFPVMEPLLRGNELNYIIECIKTNWISSQGAFVRRFEREFADYIGVDNAITVSNGTTGLHLALAALGIGVGDEVILPDLTFAASINAILYVGAKPVLADVCRDTWTLNCEDLERLVTPRTKAIMPVHLYGQPAELNAIIDIAKRYGIYIVEDAAEALGAMYHGKHVGAYGDAAVFSFFGNKLITTGEGGMIVFRDPSVAERARRLRDHGMEPTRRYWHTEVGYNYRLTNLQAAIGVAQLEQIDNFIQHKLEIGECYRRNLESLNLFQLPHVRDGIRNVYWLYSVILDHRFSSSVSRDDLLGRLLKNGIECRPLFFPLHSMPPYEQYGMGPFPNTEWLSANGLSLPSAVALTHHEIEYICMTIKHISDTRLTGINFN